MENLDKVYHWLLSGGQMPFGKKKMIKYLDILLEKVNKALRSI
jgi:hypothetical protein